MNNILEAPDTAAVALKHQAPIRNIAWLPDSHHIFSADDHGVLILSRVPDGQPLGVKHAHLTSISALKAARHEQLVATAAVDGVVRIWKYSITPDQHLVIDFLNEAKFEGEVAGIDFRPGEDTTLAIADSSGAVSLWRTLDGSTPIVLAKLLAQANSTAWSPDGRLLGVGCDDFAVHLLDVEAGTGKVFHGHNHHADQLGYSRCGRYLASGSHDRTVRVWDVANGHEIATLEHDLDTVKPDWAADGRLATCSYDRKIRIWDPLSGALLHTLTGHTYDVDDLSWSPNGAYLASCGWDNRVLVYDGDTYDIVTRIEGATSQVYALTATPDGRELFAGTTAGSVFRIHREHKGADRVHKLKRSNNAVITSLSVSPDQTLLAHTTSDAQLILREINHESNLRMFHQHHDLEIDTVRFSHCGRYLATGARENSVLLYRVDGMRLNLLHRIDHERRVKAIAWAHDAARVATGADGNIRIFDAATGVKIAQWRAHERMINALVWTPDGKHIVSACWDRLIRVFRTDGTLVHTLEGSRYNVNSISVDDSGHLLASACWDGSVSVWNMETGEMLRRAPVPDGTPVHGVHWIPKASAIAVSTWGGHVYEYDSATDSWTGEWSVNH